MDDRPKLGAALRRHDHTDKVGQGGLRINTTSGSEVETFAVTLEPVGTTAAPTGPMVLVSKQS